MAGVPPGAAAAAGSRPLRGRARSRSPVPSSAAAQPLLRVERGCGGTWRLELPRGSRLTLRAGQGRRGTSPWVGKLGKRGGLRLLSGDKCKTRPNAVRCRGMQSGAAAGESNLDVPQKGQLLLPVRAGSPTLRADGVDAGTHTPLREALFAAGSVGMNLGTNGGTAWSVHTVDCDPASERDVPPTDPC